MERQTPGDASGKWNQFVSSYPWCTEPSGEEDTRRTDYKSSQLHANSHLSTLGDSWSNSPNGAPPVPGDCSPKDMANEHKSRDCTTSLRHIKPLEVETYGPLLATEEVSSEMEELVCENMRSQKQDDSPEVLGGDHNIPGYVNCDLSGRERCGWSPQSVNEKQCLTDDNIPKPGITSCSCQGRNSDPEHLYSACRTCFCSFSCHHFTYEHGDHYCPDPLGSQDGQEDDEEEAQYDDVGPEEAMQRQHGEHSIRKKGGKRQRNRSATKDREEVKDEAKKECRTPSTKHRLSRKKSHMDGRRHLRPEVPKQVEELAIFCVSSFRMFIDLVVFITHRCGEYVESGAIVLYTFCHLKTCNLDSVRVSLQNSVQGLGLWTRSLSLKLKHWGFSWGAVAFRLLKMLCALLFLVLMLFIGCLRLCWRHVKSVVGSVAEKVFRAGSAKRSTSPCGLPFLHRAWDSFREWKACKYLTGLLRKWLWNPWTSKKLQTEAGTTPAATGSPSAGCRFPSTGEVERLLALSDIPEEELNPFQVLGVEMNASDTELKKAYRQLAVLVHPDKNTHPRAEEAFKVVRAAWDIVSNPEKRKEYEIKRMSESELAKSMNELLSKLQDDLKEAMNTMMCSKCQGKHKRFEMERDPLAARYCAECSKSHPAEEGDFWAESSMLGLKITYFAMMDGKVYDITEWAGCQRVGISPDTHRVPYHISFGSKNSGATGRPRTVPESSPASAADLQDLFNRIFQGPPGPMPNGGGLFTTPQQTPPPHGASPPAPPKPESVPKTETKPKRRKKVRRPFQR
ncbi:dnaJ homolog subfamily C member 14 [Ambystoma mexicanum]|uniref:dnaJ homolog subfamily C member 14 n=1 Tax=Ambystoma mexicanum TaxID=8296 RepID=UPI0037E9166D